MKEFKTYQEQIKILESRGIRFDSVEEENAGISILKELGYYNLINGYKEMFLSDPANNSDSYIPGTKLTEIRDLYIFDRKLREIFLKYILQVEVTLKSHISYTFSELYGHENYLVYNNFDTTLRDAYSKITKLIAKIQSEISNKSNDPSISHYLVKYGYIPLWVLSNIITLGTLSKFYSLMKQKDRQEVSRQYKVMDNQLKSIMYYLSNIRNYCAHGNRLYCYKSNQRLVTLPAYSMIYGNSDTCGKNDLFAAVISLKYLLPDTVFRSFIDDIKLAFTGFLPNTAIVTERSLCDRMGFPENWDTVLLY